MTYTPQNTITKICKKYHRDIIQPKSLIYGRFDSMALLQALAQIESSYGRNNNPRFEKAYAPPNGSLYRRSRLLKKIMHNYDGNALIQTQMASSWSPWQIMYICAYEMGFRGLPEELTDPEVSIKYVIRFINKRIMKKKPKFLVDVFDAYNSGNFRDNIVPVMYMSKCMAAYKKYSKQNNKKDDWHVINYYVDKDEEN